MKMLSSIKYTSCTDDDALRCDAEIVSYQIVVIKETENYSRRPSSDSFSTRLKYHTEPRCSSTFDESLQLIDGLSTQPLQPLYCTVLYCTVLCIILFTVV